MPGSDWEWYFLARHHGLPSRLLDWTESLFTAAYFAVLAHLPKDRLELDQVLNAPPKPPSLDECPTVWILDAGSLNLVSIGHDRIAVPGGPRTASYLPDALLDEKSTKNRNPVAVLPVRANPRIVAQHGMFTVHGHDHVSIDAIASAHNDVKLGRVRLDTSSVTRLTADLRTCGVHLLTTFPDLDSVAKHICWICQSAV